MATGQEEGVIDPDSNVQPSPAAFAKARASRPQICGSYAPERPYPIYLRGIVERGFGRGGKDLGCPTANLPSKVLLSQSHLNRTGIYFGFARVLPQDPDDPDLAGANEEDAQDLTGPGAFNGTQNSEEYGDNDDDPRDDEWEVDEEEVVLAASPLAGESEVMGMTSLAAPTKAKQRQMSKSSTRSVRSVASMLEKVNSPHGQIEGGSGQSPIVGATQGTATTVEPLFSSSTEQHQMIPSSTSNAGSLRRCRKRRVAIAATDQQVYPMVMSVGWNPFYKNTTKTAEIHVMHKFAADFYGLEMRVVVLGYIRPEFNYVSKEALIEDIEMDKQVALNSLARNLYQDYSSDPFLLSS